MRFDEGKIDLSLVPSSALRAAYPGGDEIDWMVLEFFIAARDGHIQTFNPEEQMELLRRAVPVLRKGAEKYAPWNWAKGMNWSKIWNPGVRHCLWLPNRGPIDPDLGSMHSQNAACNVLFLQHYEAHKHYHQFDDIIQHEELFGGKR